MNSVDIYVVVEGQTEQTFVRDVLAPYMANKRIFIYAVLIGKPGHKGGDVRFEKAEKDICNFLKQRQDTFVSTMFDFFRIESSWPGKPDVDKQIQTGAGLSASQKAEILETETFNKILEKNAGGNVEKRFIPYIEMHEFEALLFCNAGILAKKAEIDESKIQEIIDQYDNPEEINDDPKKAPSKRLIKLNGAYRKVAIGKAVSEEIGIKKIREKCPHFNDWLTILERGR